MGIFFATPPFGLEKTPVVTTPGICRCAVMPPRPEYPIRSTVNYAGADFVALAVEHLKARGRSRIAVIGYHPDISALTATIEAAGLTARQWWLLAANIRDLTPCRPLARLLFHPGQDELPDGLIVCDDNLVDQLALGIQDMGIDVPRDLDIVSLCNYPLLPETPLPITYLGYDMFELLHKALDALARERDTNAHSRELLPLHFQHDMPDEG